MYVIRIIETSITQLTDDIDIYVDFILIHQIHYPSTSVS